MFSRWLLAINALTTTSSISSVILGAILSLYLRGVLSLELLVVTVLGIFIMHAGINLIHDYQDYISGADLAYRSRYSGHRVNPIIDLNIRPTTVKYVGYIHLLIALSIGIYLALTRTLWILLVLGLGALFGVGYSVRPLRFRYRGFGEVLAAISTGPLTCLGSYLVQTCTLHEAPLIIGVSIGIFTFIALVNTGLAHRETDLMIKKYTLSNLLSIEKLKIVMLIAVMVGIISLILSVMLNYVPTLSLVALTTYIPLLRSVMKLTVGLDKYLTIFRKMWYNLFILRVIFTVIVTLSILIESSLASW